MASLTYDALSLLLGNRRLWIVGADLESSLVPRERWRTALAALRMAGFNTVRTSAPWNVHEPRQGQRSFAGSLDIGAFLAAARQEGLHVIVRAGPVVGSPFADGGLPAWTMEHSSGRVREAHDVFLGAVSAWFHDIFEQVAPHQAAGQRSEAESGPVIGVELEQHWQSGDPDAAEPYFAYLVRIARECGIQVPLFTNNGLWVQSPGTIEMWEGSADLFSHSRQLRTVQPSAPGVVLVRPDGAPSPGEMLRRLGSVLASGSQFIVSGGLGTHESPTPTHRMMRRIASFAASFGAVLASCNPALQTYALDPDAGPKGAHVAVPLSGGAGSVVCVFGPREGSKPQPTQLVTPDGRTLVVQLGDATVGWYLFGVDLNGSGRLDWCNLSPFALVGRRMLVLQGPAGMRGMLSVDGTVLEFSVPTTGVRPLLIQQQRLLVVVLSQQQADAAIVHANHLIVGADCVNPDGSFAAAPGFRSAVRVAVNGALHELEPAPRRSARGKAAARVSAAAHIAPVHAPAISKDHTRGTHSGYALMKAPQTLSACGAAGGAGWYRITMTQRRAGTRRLLWPAAGGRISWWLDGEPVHSADARPMVLKLSSGVHQLVALVEHVPNSVAGATLVPAGFSAQPLDVNAPKRINGVRAAPGRVDPFTLRRHLRGVARGSLATVPAAQWSIPASKGARAPRYVLDLSQADARGVLSIGAAAFALVDPTEQASTLVTIDQTAPRAPAATAAAAAALPVRFTPFDGDADAAIERVLARARWFVEDSEQSTDAALVWAFARATPRSDATSS